MNRINSFLLSFLVSCLVLFQVTISNAQKGKTQKALIIDGQSNHGIWPKATAMMKDYLEQIGFEVTVERTAIAWVGPHNDNDPTVGKERRMQFLTEYPVASAKAVTSVEKPAPDPDFKPDFSKYNLVVSNFGWNAAPLPKETQTALEKYVSGGGGLVIIHAGSNSFPEWTEFNKMVGLGGWGGRSEKTGPYVYYDKSNTLVRDTTKGSAGSHGKQQEFLITIRDKSHPITKGMPDKWLHAQDELYERLRGPAEKMTVLATAYSDETLNATRAPGSGRHEPMIMTIDYGKGRIFHTPMGHTDYSMECVGFIVTFQRGAEWAATGKVKKTADIPKDFPTADKVSQRKWTKK
jgi:uncharacterized protein